MRVVKQAADVGRPLPGKCDMHPSGHTVFDLVAGEWACSSCLESLPDERPKMKVSEAMLADMLRLGIDPEE